MYPIDREGDIMELEAALMDPGALVSPRYVGILVNYMEWDDGPPESLTGKEPHARLPYIEEIDDIENGQRVVLNGEDYVRNGFGHTTIDGEKYVTLSLTTPHGWRRNMENCNKSLARSGKRLNPVDPKEPAVNIDELLEGAKTTEPESSSEGYTVCVIRRDPETGRYTFADAPKK